MATPQKLTAFSPDLAKVIKDYVESMIGKIPNAKTPLPQRLNVLRTVFAKIGPNRTVDGVVVHSWTEQRWAFDTKTWVDAVDPKRGDKDKANYIIGIPDPTVALPEDVVVQAELVEDSDTGANVWFANAGAALPTGQYQYQVYQMVSQDTGGWGFIAAHPMT